MTHPYKQGWIERAIKIKNYHARRLQEDATHTIKDTADELGRSIGSISQDLMLARFLLIPSFEQKLRRFRNQKDALEFVREKRAELESMEINL